METYNKLTVITGASQGLGYAFARSCAMRKRDLILVSLPNENLETTARSLQEEYKIKVLYFETDLTKINRINELVKNLAPYKINMLINNAGMGGTKKFKEASVDYIQNIISLNIQSLVLLTHQLLPFFCKNQQNYILNVASLAAFSPMPYKTVYPASKSFVLSFSMGLSREVKDLNIHVAVTCPGGLATNSEVSKRINSHKGIIQKSILTPKEVAEISINRLLKKKFVIIPGKINKLSVIFQKLVPVQTQMNVIGNKLQKEILSYSSVG
ncbi:SDR family NAD(P)-dependent oxidoreductase [Zunongwangia sp. F260]|uniref:NADP-dependent 3-hydroxy acid dehydrogenase YdfG n=1 Tax=Autumnicola lenta TaxID=3075593 RepID=A0ABU3CFF8_9FLAO|nr:SDR family NAD(P)-dependent oxidoreductase [Zunongwangia sp. F260]MDT0645083.1 SDR family NAD(P)-dependent oxidoreductase [Zunongwangia sp. F260]